MWRYLRGRGTQTKGPVEAATSNWFRACKSHLVFYVLESQPPVQLNCVIGRVRHNDQLRGTPVGEPPPAQSLNQRGGQALAAKGRMSLHTLKPGKPLSSVNKPAPQRMTPSTKAPNQTP